MDWFTASSSEFSEHALPSDQRNFASESGVRLCHLLVIQITVRTEALHYNRNVLLVSAAAQQLGFDFELRQGAASECPESVFVERLDRTVFGIRPRGGSRAHLRLPVR